MAESGRVFYRKSPEAVVIEKDGREIAVYRSVEEMIETHIKGLLAIDHDDAGKVRTLLRRYRAGGPTPD